MYAQYSVTLEIRSAYKTFFPVCLVFSVHNSQSETPLHHQNYLKQLKFHVLSSNLAHLEWFLKEKFGISAPQVAQVLWWYFFSKAIELVDTVVMVLRKRERQITFLHVFHHATMLNIWWWVMMFIPGGLCEYHHNCTPSPCLVHHL